MDISSYSVNAKIWSLIGESGVSPRAFNGLMAAFHSLDDILAATAPDIEDGFGIDSSLAEEIAQASERLPRVADFIESLDQRDVSLVNIFDKDYPPKFLELNDPPPLLFYRGRLPTAEESIVTLIGSTGAGAEGVALAVDLGEQMIAHGVSVVSGLARGIDAAALVGATGKVDQRGTLPGKTTSYSHGPTGVYAVATSGLDNLFPAENISLAEQVIQRGAVFGEYPPDVEFDLDHVDPANRLLVALGQAVVIGEILDDSVGALDIARCCVDLGKLLFVLIPTDYEITDRRVIDDLLTMGAIGVRYPEEIETITKSLV